MAATLTAHAHLRALAQQVPLPDTLLLDLSPGTSLSRTAFRHPLPESLSLLLPPEQPAHPSLSAGAWLASCIAQMRPYSLTPAFCSLFISSWIHHALSSARHRLDFASLLLCPHSLVQSQHHSPSSKSHVHPWRFLQLRVPMGECTGCLGAWTPTHSGAVSTC